MDGQTVASEQRGRAKDRQSVPRQKTREHREATTEEAIREITMTKAPAGVTELPPMKEVEEPAMQVRTPEESIINADWVCHWDCNTGLYVDAFRR